MHHLHYRQRANNNVIEINNDVIKEVNSEEESIFNSINRIKREELTNHGKYNNGIDSVKSSGTNEL